MKSNEFVKAVLDMKGFGYVLGGEGELYTPELAQKWEMQGRAAKTWTTLPRQRQGGTDTGWLTAAE